MPWNTWFCPHCRKRNRSNAARCAWCAASGHDAARRRNVFAVAERETCRETPPRPLLVAERSLK